jgi:hypothetical protein
MDFVNVYCCYASQQVEMEIFRRFEPSVIVNASVALESSSAMEVEKTKKTEGTRRGRKRENRRD